MQIQISPIRIASKAGLIVGFFLLAKFMAFAYTLSYPALIFVYLIATAFVPYLQYRYMRGFRNIFFANRPFSWAQGFSFGFFLMFFASIIVLLPHYVYYTQLLPQQFPAFMELMERTNAEMNGQLSPTIEALPKMYQQYTQTPVHILLINDWGNNLFFGGVCAAISALVLRRS